MVSIELKKAVTNYSMSDFAKNILKKSGFVVVVGITGAGKNSLIKVLLDTSKYSGVISHTTRLPRENDGVLEKNGREYWFISEDQMLKKLHKGEMLEAKIIHNRQVSGISVSELQQAMVKNKTPINEIEVQGVEELKQFYPEMLSLFIVPPDFESWQQRLLSRGEMEDQEKQARLQTAVDEIEHALEVGGYIFVINDDLAETAVYVDQIIKGNLSVDSRMQKSQKKAQKLLVDLKTHLAK